MKTIFINKTCDAWNVDGNTITNYDSFETLKRITPINSTQVKERDGISILCFYPELVGLKEIIDIDGRIV